MHDNSQNETVNILFEPKHKKSDIDFSLIKYIFIFMSFTNVLYMKKIMSAKINDHNTSKINTNFISMI